MDPETNDVVVRLAFEPIKRQLKRDLKAWEETREKRSESGRLGGLNSGKSRSKKQTKQMLQKRSKTKQNEANRSKTKQNEANEAVTDNVTVNVTGSIGSAAPDFSGETLNAEETILANRIRFEQIMVKIGASEPVARQALRKYHLHLEEQEGYPKSKKAVFAGFEKWMMNEAAFTGQPVSETGGRRMVY
jgi:hypothetical protein